MAIDKLRNSNLMWLMLTIATIYGVYSGIKANNLAKTSNANSTEEHREINDGVREVNSGVKEIKNNQQYHEQSNTITKEDFNNAIQEIKLSNKENNLPVNQTTNIPANNSNQHNYQYQENNNYPATETSTTLKSRSSFEKVIPSSVTTSNQEETTVKKPIKSRSSYEKLN